MGGITVICVGAPRDGWMGTIMHGRKIRFPTDPKAEYEMTDSYDVLGRMVCVAIEHATKQPPPII